jgi:hypothetical protein
MTVAGLPVSNLCGVGNALQVAPVGQGRHGGAGPKLCLEAAAERPFLSDGPSSRLRRAIMAVTGYTLIYSCVSDPSILMNKSYKFSQN